MHKNITIAAKPAASAPGGVRSSLRALLQHQALKYLLIGGAASAIDVLLFMALYNLAGFTEWQSHSVSVPTSVLFSFVINARHNFKTSDHMLLRLFSFSAVCLLGFLVGYGVIEAAKTAGLNPNIGKVLSLPVVFILQYALNSRITFRKAKARSAA